MSSLQTPASRVKVWDLVVNVDGYLEGNINDWPANIVEKILEQFEALAKKVQLPLKIVASKCDVNYATEEGAKDTFFLHVVVSEIVAGVDAKAVRTDAHLRELIAKQTRRILH